MTRKYYNCPNCGKRARLKTFAPDRVALERDRGERFRVTCITCGQQATIHVNDVTADANHLPTYAVVALCTILWVLAFAFGLLTNIFGLLMATSLIGLPVLVRKAVEKQTIVFNEYRL